jgi:cytidyltransferase-like protein
MKIIITSLYANPLHPGHVEYLEQSKQLGDKLITIVNNDYQQYLKIGKIFQNEEFRIKIVKSLKCVDEVFLSIDNDPSVCESIRLLYQDQKYYHPDAEIIFAKGGDRFVGNIPEVEVCNQLGIKIVDGLGDKIHSSTDYRI